VEDQIKILTAHIVSAHVARNVISADQLSGLIRNVHHALSTAGQTSAEPGKAEPAVASKKSVFADRIVCLDRGKGFKMLKRHISTDHRMTPDEYRAKWGLPASYSMVAADYAAKRSKLAKASGLGRKMEPPPRPKKMAKKSVKAPSQPKKRGRSTKG
jgi:predicted transcriptional regulator